MGDYADYYTECEFDSYMDRVHGSEFYGDEENLMLPDDIGSSFYFFSARMACSGYAVEKFIYIKRETEKSYQIKFEDDSVLWVSKKLSTIHPEEKIIIIEKWYFDKLKTNK